MSIFNKIFFDGPKALDTQKEGLAIEMTTEKLSSKNDVAGNPVDTEKERFFKIYKKAVSEEINWDELSYEEVMRIGMMLDEEVLLRSKILRELKDENKQLEEDIINKKRLISSLKKQINSSM